MNCRWAVDSDKLKQQTVFPYKKYTGKILQNNLMLVCTDQLLY